jgi:hypothetical protein
VALRQVRERLGPAGRAEEIGNDEHDRAPPHHLEGGAQEFAQVGAFRSRQFGRESSLCRTLSTWRRPLRAGITVSTRSP